MRIAIIGCGFIANTHASALMQQKQEIVQVVDSDLSNAREFAERWKIKQYSALFEDALSDDVDCVHVCTPPMFHFDMVRKILLAGKHVICEKPLCLEANQAKSLYELTKEKNLIGAVNFNVRYHDACQKAKDAILDAGFGPIRLIHGSYLQEFHMLPAAYMWRYIPDFAGKMRAVTEIGSHWIDLVRFWTGLEIVEVSSSFGVFEQERKMKNGVMYGREFAEGSSLYIESEDAAIVSLRFDNNAIGSLLLSEVSPGRSNYISIEVTGSNKSVSWCSEDPYRLNKGAQFKGIQSTVNPFSGGFPETFSTFFEQVYKQLQTSTNECAYPTFYDGYKNAAICEAIYSSAKSNSSWVEVK